MARLEEVKYYNMVHDGEIIFSFSSLEELKSETHRLGLPFLSGQRYANEYFMVKYRDQILYFWNYDQKATSFSIDSEDAKCYDLLDKGVHNRTAYWLCCLRAAAPDLVPVMRPYIEALYRFHPMAQLAFHFKDNVLDVKQPGRDEFYRAWFNDQNQLTELRKIDWGSVPIELIGKEITPENWQKALKLDYDLRIESNW